MYRLNALTLLPVRTEVPSVHPQLDTPPRAAYVWLGTASFVRVERERQPDRESAGVAEEPLPKHCHRCTSIPIAVDFASTNITSVQPLHTDPNRHGHPADRITVPDAAGMLLRTERLTFEHRIPLVPIAYAGRQQSLRLCSIDVGRTAGTTATHAATDRCASGCFRNALEARAHCGPHGAIEAQWATAVPPASAASDVRCLGSTGTSACALRRQCDTLAAFVSEQA